MLKKRIIGVITVKNGWAVQSVSFERYLPLGRPELLAENLDRWGVDEILIQCIDRTNLQLGPDYHLLSRLAAIGISTPLVYGGGINSVAQAAEVIAKGADRVLLDTAFIDNQDSLRRISSSLGAQAIIASIPLTFMPEGIRLWNYRTKTAVDWPQSCGGLLAESVISEVLLIDKDHEGMQASFDISLLNAPFLRDVCLIPFGGITQPRQMSEILRTANVSAIAIGNSLNYCEHSVQLIRQCINSSLIRQFDSDLPPSS